MRLITRTKGQYDHLEGELNGPYKVVVPLSGGKDSQVCLALALEEYEPHEVLAMFNDTGFEHPLTYAHVENVTAFIGVDLVVLAAGTVRSVCTALKRMPGGPARHCTDRLKLRPSRRFYKELARVQGGYEVWIGIRSDESPAREKRYKGKIATDLYMLHEFMPSTYPQYLGTMGVKARLPIIDWATDEVFAKLGTSANPLYTRCEGTQRVGCFPCLASRDASKLRDFRFDETGAKHYEIAKELSEIAGHPLFNSKGHDKYNDGCAICSI